MVNRSAYNASSMLAYTRLYHLVDMKHRILGRACTEIAQTLMGKHKPIFHPQVDCGDYVVVINAQDLRVTGRKMEQKIYYSHSGYPGALKKLRLCDMMEKGPDRVIRKCIHGMLPRDEFRPIRLARLFIFPDDHHPFEYNIFRKYVTPIPTSCDLARFPR